MMASSFKGIKAAMNFSRSGQFLAIAEMPTCVTRVLEREIVFNEVHDWASSITPASVIPMQPLRRRTFSVGRC